MDKRVNYTKRNIVVICRIGDFYEALGKNADILEEVLGLHVEESATGRRTGFTKSSYDNFIGKLVRAGYRVEVVDDEKPKKTEYYYVVEVVDEKYTDGELFSRDSVAVRVFEDFHKAVEYITTYHEEETLDDDVLSETLTIRHNKKGKCGAEASKSYRRDDKDTIRLSMRITPVEKDEEPDINDDFAKLYC